MTVIHRGPIPGTGHGHHWFEAGGERFAVCSSPHYGNRGWAYEIDDENWRLVDDSCFTFREIRLWAADRDADAGRRADGEEAGQ